VACLLLVAPFAQAGGLIRDTEIEHTLRRFTAPIFRAAGLVPENVNLFIVQDPSLNAYVAGGSNIFIHTGLMIHSDHPALLIGVMAHEAGHIAGGHLAQGSEQLANAHISTILTYVLGALAAAGGGGEVGSAVMSAGQHLAQRNLLSFTRRNEQAADQAALQYLERAGMSASGLLELLQQLRVRETVYRNKIDPYALTHPLSKERVAHIRSSLLQSDVKEGGVPSEFLPWHTRMRAKLQGFLQKPQTTLEQYPASDQSLAARYARAVAYHRLSELENSLKEIDALLAESPQDPYFLELKGQVLSESSRHAKALQYYAQAAEILPDAALIRAAYGRELMAQQSPQYQAALTELKQASMLEPRNSMVWKLLADCYQALGQHGQASLSHAEAALYGGELDSAIDYARTALSKLDENAPARLRAKDLMVEAKRLKREKDS
jgi:predicted Zn-dependent protease